MQAMRARIADALRDAEAGDDPVRTATLRLVLTALRDRERAARRDDGPAELTDEEAIALMRRMLAHREKSMADYEQAAQMDLADRERREARILAEFLPRPLTDAEADAAVSRAIAETGASSIRDMGKVMAHLKRKYPGRLDFAATSARVKTALA